jgi:two-component system phosphate regulon response regulator PhoB
MGGEGRRPVVLVVEDDEHVYDLLSEFLASCGFSVYGAASGDELLVLVEQLHPQAVILDHEIALARQLRARDHRLPILLVTGRVELQLEGEAKAAGCDGVVRKPFHLDQLAEELHRVMA